MQVKDLVLGIYNKFSPAEEGEKAKVNSEINNEWNAIVTDEKHALYKKNWKTALKKATQDPWLRAALGVSYVFILKWFIDLINGKNDDDIDENKITYKD